MQTFYVIAENKFDLSQDLYFKNNIDIKFINTKDSTFKDELNKIPKNSIIFTNIKNDDNNLKWFNNSTNVVSDINNIIIDNNLTLIKLKKICQDKFNIFDIIYLIKYTSKDLDIFYDKNDIDKRYKIIKKLKDINYSVIIGNGKNHLDNKFIDKSDFVCRVNGAKINAEYPHDPVEGYSHIVGSKTNLYFKGGSAGICDSSILSDPKCLKLTSSDLWNKQLRDWMYSGYYLKHNWYEILRKTRFMYYKKNMEEFKIRKDLGFFSSGCILVLIMLKLNFELNSFKLYISGFEHYKKYNESLNNNDEKTKIKTGHGFNPDLDYNDEVYPYYFKLAKEECIMADPNNNSIKDSHLDHNMDNSDYVFNLLIENEILFN